MGAGPLTPTIHESELGYWELRPCQPSPRISPFVRRIDGYVQRAPAATPTRHRQMPGPLVPFIISLGEPLRSAPAHDDRVEPYPGFVAGLHDSYAITEFTGTMSGVQIDFTPPGMRMLLGGMPMHELTNRIVHLGDVLGPAGRDLTEQLQDDVDWDARFERLDAFIARRIERAPAPAEDVAFAWHRLQQTAGCISIGGLADELGYSRKQLIGRFRTHIGLTPKLAARIFRFEHARQLLQDADEINWADIAFDAGYYDQSHLIRDFVEFSGSSPTDYVARTLPDSGGMRAD